jgi:uncharacterized peroxidase-related enzyme
MPMTSEATVSDLAVQVQAMPHIPVCSTIEASTDSLAVYEEFYTQMRFSSAPNFIMTQGHSPTVARGTWDLVRSVLVSGELPRWIKEMMFVAISSERKCRYCTAAHIACCRMLSVNPDWIKLAAVDVNAIPDKKLREMILFALKCSRDPQSLAETDYAKLRKHGLENKEIVEIISMAGLAVYANILADATGMEEDPMFDAY